MELVRRGIARAASIAALPLALAACGSSRKVVARPRPLPTPTGTVGSCADPQRDGAVSAAPRLERADRDLDGDGRSEIVVTDRARGTDHGNRDWHLDAPGAAQWARSPVTAPRAALSARADSGDRGFHGLRAWWRLSGGGRLLMEEYRFRHDGYRVVDSLLCRRAGGDRIECAPPLRRGNGGLP